MKKFFFILATATLFVACNQNKPADPEEQQKATFAKAMYFETLGTNTVPNVEGDNKDLPFVMDSVRAEVVIVSDTTLDLYLYKIAFASAMAQRALINMTLPALKYTRTVDKITFSGENIDVLMGVKSSGYISTKVTGYITADSLVVANDYSSPKRGSYPGCSYAGKVIDMQEKQPQK